MSSRPSAVIAALIVCACREPDQAVRAADASSARAPAPATHVPARGGALRQQLAPVVVSPPPKLLVLAPAHGQELAVELAPDLPLELEAVAQDGSAVDLHLDRYRPLRLDELPARPRLSDLVPADSALDPGEHVLLAVLVNEDGRVLYDGAGAPIHHLVTFWVGSRTRPTQAARSPAVFLGQPRGTYHGESALPIDVLPINASLGPNQFRVELAMTHLGFGETLWHVERSGAFLLNDLPSGDYRIEARLRDASGAWAGGELGSISRSIVINRDLPRAAPR